MTIDEAIRNRERFERRFLYDESIDYQLTSDDAEWLEMAISALRANQETEKNEPLTLDELREMDREPVYAIWENEYKGEWFIVLLEGDSLDNPWTFVGFYEIESGRCKAYRRPPKEKENE